MSVEIKVPTPDGERAFTIGRPPARVYVNLLKFISHLLVSGYEQAVRKMASIVAAGGELDDNMLIFYAIDQLEVEDLERLAALLLHFGDEAEGMAFVRQAGFDLTWVTEALAANAEQIEAGVIVKNLRRATDAVARQIVDEREKVAPLTK